jgi:uncharacterized protein with HEPN domain
MDRTGCHYPDVDWYEMKGFRNIIVHHYFGIEADIVWNIVINDIPVLKTQIQNIINSLEQD